VIAYKFGNHFVLDLQKVCDGRGNQMAFNGARYDAVWTNPQHEHTNRSFWEACYRCPVVVLPHIWEPIFADRVADKLGCDFGYKPGCAKGRIAIYEPSIEVVKSCHIPMLVCDLVYRERPELIDIVWVTNAAKLTEQLTFKTFYNMLDIAKAKASDGKRVCSCESRWNLIQFQSQHADICVSWQWENALNYAYYEMLHGHYPLVHNSEMLPGEVGYRYSGFDAHDGARALLDALTKHDDRLDEYNESADRFLATVHPLHPKNIAAHDSAIRQVAVERLVA
jgi:hypothetical protein